VLPTGRNLYSVDPKAIPSPLAWEVGVALAERLVDRHLAETGSYPRTVGLVVWGTANMRTQGDDVAEALALLGVRPRWHDQSGRVVAVRRDHRQQIGRRHTERRQGRRRLHVVAGRPVGIAQLRPGPGAPSQRKAGGGPAPHLVV